jgi:hypothetical protein
MGHGSNEFNLQSPTTLYPWLNPAWYARGPDVALQVAFERRTLKPIFSLDRL